MNGASFEWAMRVADHDRANAKVSDPFAEYLAANSQPGLDEEASCHVGEGLVHSRIRIRGESAEATATEANAIRLRFEQEGYSAGVSTDAGDPRTAIVTASLPIAEYVRRNGGG